jgi:aminoglycoside phosphotransferase (APT) family kinase protein
VDEQGREILSFLPGDVVQYPLPEWIWHPSILRDAASLLRQIHDSSVGLAHETLSWQLPTHEPVEVVCHNDFAPYNMVFQDQRFAGIGDFDAASPGPRILDFAYLAYQLVPFIEGGGVAAPEGPERMGRLDELIAAYGLPFPRRDVLKTLGARLVELADYSEGRAAATGRPELNDHAAMYRRDSIRMVQLAKDA